ncbi:Putative RNAI modulator protein [Escherichia coli]|nr:Putative RNAI modulator protein [Escherichia coli]
MCEKLHELAEELQNSIQTRFEAEIAPGYNASGQDAERHRGA